MVAVLSQIGVITPVPMPQPQPQPPAGAATPFGSFMNDQQQLQAQQQSPIPSYNVLAKDRYQAQQDDPRLNYLRDLIERLQALEYQERQLAIQSSPMAYDYQNDVSDYSLFSGNPEKRAWEQMHGMWGKRAPAENWNKFRGNVYVDMHGTTRNFSNCCGNIFLSQDLGANGSRVGII